MISGLFSSAGFFWHRPPPSGGRGSPPPNHLIPCPLPPRVWGCCPNHLSGAHIEPPQWWVTPKLNDSMRPSRPCLKAFKGSLGAGSACLSGQALQGTPRPRGGGQILPARGVAACQAEGGSPCISGCCPDDCPHRLIPHPPGGRET